MSQNAISLEDAAANRFETSVRSELVDYCTELGLDLDGIDTDSCDPRVLHNMLFGALGLAHRHSEARADGAGARRQFTPSQSKVNPPVNLTPNGKWGGRRRRVLVPRPENTEAKAESWEWNGKAAYWLPYGEVVAVPWPIYCQMRDTKKRRPIQKKTPLPSGSVEITTAWEFDPFVFNDQGDDPVTKDLPTSMTDFYQSLGYEQLARFSQRELSVVAARLDVRTYDNERKALQHGQLLEAVTVFLFGYSSDSVENGEIEFHNEA